MPTEYIDITEFGSFAANDHSELHSLHGGRTAITTEALVAYNGLRAFFGLAAVDLPTVGQWAFDNTLTNNATAWQQDLQGVGLYYAMQGAKVAWIRDDAFDPQILADIQRTARLGSVDDVMAMVEAFGQDGFAEYLGEAGLVDEFVNTLKMEPHYGGWMHGRVHGWLPMPGDTGAQVAIAHDLNHLTVLSHDQTQPFMNDTFDWPQWPALDVPTQDVIDYFQSMLVLGTPLGDDLPAIPVNNLSGQDNTLNGTGQDDHANGLAGEDVMYGKGGDDDLSGGRHDDALFGGAGADRLFGEAGNDTLKGASGADLLMGGGGADQIYGGRHSDRILGGSGDDNIRGGKGDDHITDGAGADVLSGNKGNDIFAFVADGEVDKIKDFTDGEDLIALDGVTFGDLSITENNAGHVVIEYGDEAIFLKDTDGSLSVSDFTGSDFLFT